MVAGAVRGMGSADGMVRSGLRLSIDAYTSFSLDIYLNAFSGIRISGHSAAEVVYHSWV